MNKKHNIMFFKINIATIFLIIITFFVSAIASSVKHNDFEFRMFNTIDSFEILNEYIQEPIENDKYLDDLVPIDYFRNVVKWNGKKYEVYAYVFSNVNECHQYTENRHDHYFSGNKSFYWSGNHFFSTKYIIFVDNYLLFIDGPGTDDMYNFLSFLQQDFDVKF